jgi:hypothetical protein
MKIETSCSQCGKNIALYRYKKQTDYFCSSTCYGLWQRGKKFSSKRLKIHVGSRKHGLPNVTCVTCGRIFHRHPSAIHKLNFCSTEHKKKYWPPRQIHSPKQIKTFLVYKCIFCGREFSPKRESAKYCSRECYGLANRKAYIIKKGYKKILQPNHPRADGKGYVFEHIIVLENKLGRPLIDDEESHHIDGNKLNNSDENLMAFKNHIEHMKLHLHHSISPSS